MGVFENIMPVLQSGLGSLASYLAAHVLLCLVPAFFIAGGLSAMVPQQSVSRYLGRSAPKYVAYPAATLAGSVLAVCSCTILPLFAGIYKKGAGLGPAITFLFFAPAANILALAYTGVAIGGDFALARLSLSLIFGVGIGMIMALIFRTDDLAHAQAGDNGFLGREELRPVTILFLFLLVVLLLVGTLKLRMLLTSYVDFIIPLASVERFQELLNRLVPFDAARGEEGVTVQGVLLIALLAIIALSAWRGFGRVHDGFSRWTRVSLWLIVLTLLIAAVKMQPQPHGLKIGLTGRVFGVALAMIGVFGVGRRFIAIDQVQQWLWETWRFVRQIFPLLVIGVFAVGIGRYFIRPEWVRSVAGANTVPGNLVGVVFGVFMYFPTLVEVPVAKMFLSLGMHRGPLIAYIMADPELSLQSILITAAIIGRIKAWTYVGWVALFSTVSGLMYGAYVDGASAWHIAAYLGTFVVLLGAGLAALTRRRGGLA